MYKQNTATTLASASTLTSGTSWTSSTVDLTAAYDARIFCELNAAGVAPSIPGKVEIEASPDGTNWFPYYNTRRGPLNINANRNHTVRVPMTIPYVRVKVTAGNTTLGYSAYIVYRSIP